MTPAARIDAIDRLKLAVVGCSDIEQDSSLPGWVRLRAALMRKHINLVESALRAEEATDVQVERTHNDHLGARAE